MSTLEKDSFSHKVKEELKDAESNARHCQLAELVAIVSFVGRIKIDNGDIRLEVRTEHEYVREKYEKLLKKSFGVDALTNSQDTLRVLAAMKIWDENNGKFRDLRVVNQTMLQQSCCKRAYIRGAFLAAGSMSNPNKAYHLEIVCQGKEQAEQLKSIINTFDMDAKVVMRKKNFVVYLKEGENIVDLLNVMGAYKALMNLENVRIVKEVRNTINRQVNCETANIEKTVNAAVKQINSINYIQKKAGLGVLPDTLAEMAQVRLENPDTPLKDLGAMLSRPIGKSGVNHRLKKIMEIAENMGFESEKSAMEDS